MPYDRNADLPKSVRDNLPQGAQTIYRKAFNSAWEQYDEPKELRGSASREISAYRVASVAVKKSYQKSDDRWVKMG